MNYSYKRVSTKKQDERRQDISLDAYFINYCYVDKASGKNKNRPELNKLMLDVKKGDNVYCESISRLARNVDDLRELVEHFKEEGVTVHFLKEGFNTEGNTYKFVLTILGAVAEMEREMIVERVNEGIEKAKRYGTRSGQPIGRPKRTLPKSFDKYYPKYVDGQITGVEFARLLEVSRATLYRHMNDYKSMEYPS